MRQKREKPQGGTSMEAWSTKKWRFERVWKKKEQLVHYMQT